MNREKDPKKIRKIRKSYLCEKSLLSFKFWRQNLKREKKKKHDSETLEDSSQLQEYHQLHNNSGSVQRERSTDYDRLISCKILFFWGHLSLLTFFLHERAIDSIHVRFLFFDVISLSSFSFLSHVRPKSHVRFFFFEVISLSSLSFFLNVPAIIYSIHVRFSLKSLSSLSLFRFWLLTHLT